MRTCFERRLFYQSIVVDFHGMITMKQLDIILIHYYLSLQAIQTSSQLVQLFFSRPNEIFTRYSIQHSFGIRHWNLFTKPIYKGRWDRTGSRVARSIQTWKVQTRLGMENIISKLSTLITRLRKGCVFVVFVRTREWLPIDSSNQFDCFD